MDTSKIIKGAVSNGRYTVTAPIVKEDYGLYLQIEGVELPSTYEVDFSNSENSGTSITMVGNSNKVRIPAEFIETGKDIFAFLYVVGSGYGRTVYKFRIPNKLRPDRTYIAPTPEEQSVIDQAISALNSAVAQTAQDKADADASAQNASADAERAEEARTDAQNYATQAEQARDDAQTYANNASASATASASSASASANSASQAQGYAQSASASAQSASGYASNAQTSANTASNKASEASTSAQTASNKASEASQSASQALTYKTDAESAKVASQTAQGLAESARDSAVQAKNDAESARDDAESARDEAQQAVESISGALDDKADVITDTASGSIASFSDGADDLPLKSLVIDINPIQDLSHGDPSPENICPISGWTEANVTHCGKDLLAPTDYKGEYNGSSGTDLKTASPASYEYTNTGVIISASAWGGRLFATPPLPAGTYYVHSDAISGTPRCSLYITNSNLVVTSRIKNIGGSGERFNNSVTLTQNGQRIAVEIMSSVSDNLLVPALQCEVGSAYTSYVSHTAPETIPINWQTEAGTVYGGKLDVLSGVLTVDRAMVDLGTLNWYVSSNPVGMIGHNADTSALPSALYSKPNDMTDILCEKYKTCNYNFITQGREIGVGIFGSGDARYIRIFSPEYANKTSAEVKADLSGVKLIYTLLNPIEIQLSTNQIINSLYGVNNLWADSGDTEAVYRADTKLFIERLTAPDSEDMVADANITSGKYFMVGNSLYKATANIANGSAIIVGTNCIRKSLSEALNEINA